MVIRLFPNATHLMQPLDIVVFHSLKLTWKKAVHDWRIQHCHEKQKKERFCSLLEKVLRTVMPSMLANGLRKCGLHPPLFRNWNSRRQVEWKWLNGEYWGWKVDRILSLSPISTTATTITPSTNFFLPNSFKASLFWPETSKSTPKKPREKIPSWQRQIGGKPATRKENLNN